ETNATIAENCDFAYGELHNTRAGFAIKTMANAAMSLYTDNGLTFYSWLEDVNAVRSPMSRDPFDRLYYTTPTDFRVASRSSMAAGGGPPPSSYRVGVPRPTVAPVVSVSPVSPFASATLAATFHYEYCGVKYQEQAMPLTVVTSLETWIFTPPVKATLPNGGGTPVQALPVIRLVAKDTAIKDVLLDVYTANSSLNTDTAYALSIVKTGTAEDYAVALTAANRAGDKRARAYTYTYVNIYGEEGPSSSPSSLTILGRTNVTVDVVRDAAAIGFAPIKEIRIYRTSDGSSIADFFLAGNVPVLAASGAAFSFTDAVEAADLNDALASEFYYPPDQQLIGLTSFPNGILMAWKGNELHFSDPYKPWSWPPAYVKTFGSHQVVGAIVIGSAALVTTTGPAYFISGVSPDSMTESPPLTEQAGASKWSIANVGDAIMYASHDGLVTVAGGQASMERSERFFTRDIWRAKYGAGLTGMRFSVWDGWLIVYSSAGAFVPFMINLDEARGAMTDIPSFKAACSFISPLSDQCYFMNGATLYQFAGGADEALTWQSREMVLGRPTNFGVAQAICSGNWQIAVYALVKDPLTNLSGFVLK
ncbi:hypothetical protein AAKU55_005936, partial [Oxalobacteraceae bacterium GrIS 1.11]